MLGKQVIRSWGPALQQIQRRQVSVIAGPPQVHISFAEKFATGVAMTCGWLAIPAWVMAHLKEYKGEA